MGADRNALEQRGEYSISVHADRECACVSCFIVNELICYPCCRQYGDAVENGMQNYFKFIEKRNSETSFSSRFFSVEALCGFNLLAVND